jgi:3-keto-5-aminohexanoate cleavage enzyme
MNKTRTMITVAPTGAESSTATNPEVPVSVDAIVQTAVDCEAAGAAMIHVHGRDSAERSSLDCTLLGEIQAGITERTSLIVQLSTGGGVHDSFEDRMRVLELAPESCSLTLGTVNFGDDVFHNPWPFIVELYRSAQAARVFPEFELFDLGHVATLRRLLDKYGPPHTGAIHCDLVMGVPGGIAGTAASLVAMTAQLPLGATWSATGIGRSAMPVALAAVSCGGNVRVGMEDTLTFSPGEAVRSNAQLVSRAAELIKLANAVPSTSEEARHLFGLESRS